MRKCECRRLQVVSVCVTVVL